MGKSVDCLRRSGRRENHALRENPAKENAMTYQLVCLSSDIDAFSSFATLFAAAFKEWIASQHQASFLELRAQFESRCGLQSSLDLGVYLLG